MAAPSPALPTVGADAGASLIKLALRDARGGLSLECFPSEAHEQALARIQAGGAGGVGLTGCGAQRLAGQLDAPTRIEEFDAWGQGARLRAGARDESATFLMVSLGTGTTVLRVTPESIERVGGTALGGGTLLGLGAALLGTRDFDTIADLAARGDHSRVDLTVGDLYGSDFELPAAHTAASLAKLQPGVKADAADLAQAVMAMLGENIGRTCALLAGQHGAGRVLFGGGCLRGNPLLGNLLRGMCMLTGVDAEILEDGEYTGALGALSAAEAATCARATERSEATGH